MATPAHPAASGAPPRIQRFTGQATGQVDTAPASVDRVLASPGNPLEPMLRQDMEQRFGHDFSRVRVHSGTVAEQSARDVSAHAYTVRHNVVFGAGRLAPRTHQGRRLIAHELTHVVQQAGALIPRIQRQAAVLPPVPTTEDPRFEGFSPAQKLVLEYAEAKAFEVLDRMVVDLLPWLASVDTQIAFVEQFHTVDPDRMIRVSLILARVRKKLPATRYVYRPDCKYLAWTLPLTGPIYICPLFFEQDVAGRYNALIHEGAHRFACRMDLGYAFNKRYDELSVLRQLWNAEPYGELAEEMDTGAGGTP